MNYSFSSVNLKGTIAMNGFIRDLSMEHTRKRSMVTMCIGFIMRRTQEIISIGI